jgi:hypothetical protein
MRNPNYIFQIDNIQRNSALNNGQVFYDRGIPCKRGHICLRYAKSDKCIECIRIAKLTWRKRNPEQVSSDRKKYHLKELYKITPEQYDCLLMLQNGVCRICKKPETQISNKNKKIKMLAVDHCHNTNQIRGLLCASCNQGIGKFNHDSVLLREAALYCEET